MKHVQKITYLLSSSSVTVKSITHTVLFNPICDIVEKTFRIWDGENLILFYFDFFLLG